MIDSNEEMENNTVPEMSSNEFRKILINWFENQGITTELRTHLRHQMVLTLQNTHLGRQISDVHPRLTPKTEVINLLIAEYLLKYHYHYSLSVFSSEIPSGNILQTNSRLMITKSKDDFQFTEQYVWYILEMLEFKRDSVQAQKLHDLYSRSPEKSLLVCVINACKDKTETITYDSKNKEYFNKLEPGLKNMFNVLAHFQIPQNILIDVFEHIEELLKQEKERIKSEESLKYNTLQSQVQKEMHDRELEISHLVNEMEDTFLKEKQLLFEDLKTEYDKVQLLKEKSEEKERENDKKLVILNNKEENIRQREAQVEKQIRVLQMEINERQRNVQIKSENKRIQTETKYFKKEINQRNEEIQCDILSTVKENVLYQENFSQLCKTLQLENSQLKMINRELEIRSGELTSKNLKLMKDLENAVATVNILSTKMTSTPKKVQNSSKQKIRFTPQSTIYSYERSGDSSEEDSTTDYILKEAKQRLRKLEEETKAVDRNYKEFKQRHMHTSQYSLRRQKSTATTTPENSD